MAPTTAPTLERLDADVLTAEGLDAAMRTIQDSRRTHANWATWRRRGHGTNEDHEMVGDLAYHEQAIAEYDHVLRVLRAVRRRFHADGRLR